MIEPRWEQATAVAMVCKQTLAAARTWRVLKGSNQLPKFTQGIEFRDEIEVTKAD